MVGLSVGLNGGAMWCDVFSLFFVSCYNIVIVSNFTVTAVFVLITGKRTNHPNQPWVNLD